MNLPKFRARPCANPTNLLPQPVAIEIFLAQFSPPWPRALGLQVQPTGLCGHWLLLQQCEEASTHNDIKISQCTKRQHRIVIEKHWRRNCLPINKRGLLDSDCKLVNDWYIELISQKCILTSARKCRGVLPPWPLELWGFLVHWAMPSVEPLCPASRNCQTWKDASPWAQGRIFQCLDLDSRHSFLGLC